MNDSDLDRLRSLLNSVVNIKQNGIRTKDGEGRETTQENLKLYRTEAHLIVAALPDEHLLAAYRRTVERGGIEGASLLAEIGRRRLP
jgi:hypothetical protein